MKTLNIIVLMIYMTTITPAFATNPANPADMATWKANGAMRATPRDAVLMHFYDSLYKRNPKIQSGDAIRLTNDFAHEYDNIAKDKNTNSDDITSAFTLGRTVLLINPGLAAKLNPYVAAAAIIYEFGKKIGDFTVNTVINHNYANLGGQEGIYTWTKAFKDEAGRKALAETMENSWKRSQTNPAYRDGFFALFSPSLRASPTDSADQILNSNPQLKHQIETDKRLADIWEAAKAGNISEQVTQTMINDLNAEIHNIAKQNMEIIENMHVSEMAQQQEQDRTDAIRASMDIISFVASQLGEKAAEKARQVSAIGNATLEFNAAIKRFDQISSNSGELIGGAILSGNVLQIGIALFQSLGLGGPSADEIIIQELGELRSQVAELHKTMNDRFDKIDTNINHIFTMVDSGFANLTEMLSSMDGPVQARFTAVLDNLEALKKQSYEIQNNIYRIENSTIATLTSMTLNELSELLSDCAEEMSYSQQKKCLRNLSRVGSETATSAVATQINGATSTSNEAIVSFLSANPDTELNLNYLTYVAYKRFDVTINNKAAIANPFIWRLSTNGFMRTLYNNATTSLNPTSQYKNTHLIKPLITEGEKITQAARELSETVDQIIDLYKSGVKNLARAIRTMDQTAMPNEYGITLSQALRCTPKMMSANTCDDITLNKLAVKAIKNQNPGDIIRSEELGLTEETLNKLIPTSMKYALLTGEAKIEAGINAEWTTPELGEPTIKNKRDCNIKRMQLGLYVGGCKMDKEFYGEIKSTRYLTVKSKNDQPIFLAKHDYATSSVIRKKCTSVCFITSTTGDTGTCSQIKDAECQDTDTVGVALQSKPTASEWNKTTNEQAEATIRTNQVVTALQKIQDRANAKNHELEAAASAEALMQMNAAKLLLDATLKTVYSTTYTTSDTLYGLLHGVEQIIGDDPTGELVRDMLLNTGKSIIEQRTDALTREMQNFLKKTDSPNAMPQIAKTLKEAGIILQASKPDLAQKPIESVIADAIATVEALPQ